MWTHFPSKLGYCVYEMDTAMNASLSGVYAHLVDFLFLFDTVCDYAFGHVYPKQQPYDDPSLLLNQENFACSITRANLKIPLLF